MFLIRKHVHTKLAFLQEHPMVWHLSEPQPIFCIHPSRFGVGLPQGAILRPILFLVFINDLEFYPSNAEDYVLYTNLHSENDSLRRQEDLDNLLKWKEKWLMQFHQENIQTSNISKIINAEYKTHGHTSQLVDSAKNILELIFKIS